MHADRRAFMSEERGFFKRRYILIQSNNAIRNNI